MAVIRPKSTSSRRPVEESMEENSSQDIEMTQEDDTQSDPGKEISILAVANYYYFSSSRNRRRDWKLILGRTKEM